MVKLYLNTYDAKKKNSVEYIDVSIWSLVKSVILSDLIIYGIVFGVLFLLGFFGALMLGI
jgi:hypothetical protein